MNEADRPRRKILPHFPGIERHNDPIVHLITVCTQDRHPVLASDPVHCLLREAWAEADAFLVGRYVVMPDHIHLFCTPIRPMPDYLDPWIRFWKSFVSNHWPGRKPYRLWQRDFWDTQMRSAENYGNQWDYVRLNPIRHGLVKSPDEWPYQGELDLLDWHN